MSFKCCLSCYLSLGQDVGSVWTNLCNLSLDNKGYIFFKRDNSIEKELYTLETKGFITTHETNEEIIARMEGLMIDWEFEPAFCINHDEHTEQTNLQDMRGSDADE